MYPRNPKLFSDEELLEMIDARQGLTGNSDTAGLQKQVEGNVNRVKRSAYGSSNKRCQQETPELFLDFKSVLNSE